MLTHINYSVGNETIYARITQAHTALNVLQHNQQRMHLHPVIKKSIKIQKPTQPQEKTMILLREKTGN